MAQKKENVCFAAAFFSFALIISRFVALLLAAAIAAIVIVIRRSPEICKQLSGSLALIIS
jgi:hypothetical protein